MLIPDKLRRLSGLSPGSALPASADSGFTLVEILVTLVILSVGIIVVLRAFDTSLFALAESRDCMCAAMLIREKMAELETRLREDGALSGERSGTFDGHYGDYQWETRQQDDTPPESGSATNRLSRITTAVWRSGSSRKYSAATYMRTGL